MPIAGEWERLTDGEANDLNDRVERFRAAWRADGSTGPDRFLPPAGARHRSHVLLRLIIADMELRALTGLPFCVEDYLAAFRNDLAGVVPVALLSGEYHLRHRFGDKPAVEEYRRRFPAQFEALAAELARQPAPSQTVGPRDHTPLTPIEVVVAPAASAPGVLRVSTQDDGGRAPAASKPPAVDELLVADSVQFSTPTRPRGGDSTSLSADRQYTIVRKIGKGAYGEVYEALAPGGIPVALKRILRPFDDPVSVIERDALDTVKKLSHPFLLKTNAYWVEADRLTVVMELAEYSLADRLEHFQRLGRTGVPANELVPLFQQAAEALDYLHSQNVSHRDVKPENILVLRGYAKVADFGLVRLHQHAMTEVQNTAGTPAYMAPEMWRQKVSLHSDQYALAATYVRARLGRYLFNLTSWIDQGNSHVSETPNLDPLPAAEQAVLLRALAKNPDDRFPSCTEFAQALRNAVFPPPPPPPPVTPVFQAPPTPSRWKAVLSTATIAVVCAASVWTVSYFNRPATTLPTPDHTGQKPPEAKPLEKKYPTYPTGWQPVAEEGEYHNPTDDRYYHKALARQVGGQRLIARLVHPTNPGDPPLFYMLEHKVTNKAFKALWEAVNQTEARLIKSDGAGRFRRRWESDEKEQPLNIDGEDALRPVLGVTLAEAMLAARELGGLLPTYQQWLKAAGLLEPGAVDGPAGSEVVPPSEMPQAKRREWVRERLHKRNLALARDGKPLPVNSSDASGDISKPWGIRQLVSNGQEWLDQTSNRPPVRFPPSVLPTGDQNAGYVGYGHGEDQIESGIALRERKLPPLASTTDVGETVRCGFRVVFEMK